MVFVENEANAGKGTSLMGADGILSAMSEASTEQNVTKTLFMLPHKVQK